MPDWVRDNVNDQVIDDSGNWVFANDYPTLTANTISFSDSDPDTILDSNNGFITAGFIPGTRLIVSGSVLNDFGAKTVETVAAGVLTLISTDKLNNEAAGATVTLSQIDIEANNYPPKIEAKNNFHGLQTKKISNRYDVSVDNDACVASVAPDTNFGSNITLGVLETATPEYVHVYIKTDLSNFPSGHTLDKGHLHIKRIYGVGTEQLSSIIVNRVSGADWNESTITWNNKPATSETITIDLQNIMQDTWVIIDLKTWLQNWLDGVWNNYGIALTAVSDDAIKRFRSSEYGIAGDTPFFSLFYFPYD
jgi:hypothetical protein